VNCANPIQKKSIRFRARSFVAFALTPEPPLAEWLETLDRWTENSPGFFSGRPVVLDLNLLKPKASEIGGIVSKLAERGIRIYAIEASDMATLSTDLPPLLTGAKEVPLAGVEMPAGPAPKTAPPVKVEEPKGPNSLTIASPIRSGQSIFHPHGDVIVLGSVSSGSEIIAGGSIHVYGTLRGRAIAGATGNPKARIFCLRNEAELLAVDGWYRTAEDMDTSSRGKAIQAYFENGVIWVAPLS